MTRNAAAKSMHLIGKIVETHRCLETGGRYIGQVVGFLDMSIPDDEDSEHGNIRLVRIKVLALTHYPLPLLHGDEQITEIHPFPFRHVLCTNIRNIREHRGPVEDYRDSLKKTLRHCIDNFHNIVKKEPYPDWIQAKRLGMLLSRNEKTPKSMARVQTSIGIPRRSHPPRKIRGSTEARHRV